MPHATFTLETAAPKVGAFLRALLGKAGLQLDFDIGPGRSPHPDIENPEVLVRFSGADLDLLLANRAELLLALEHLTMETLRLSSEQHSLLCFDANDYRMLRLEELRLSAVAAADRVKRSHMPFRFNPMNSRERRVLHLALRNETAVRSESTGMGQERSVVVYPAGMKSAPMPPEAPRRRR